MPALSEAAAPLPPGHACSGCPVRSETFCAVLAPAELAAFKALGTIRRFAAGQSLFHEGDRAEFVFNLVQGTLRLYRVLPDGRRQVIGFAQPGEFLGIGFEDTHGLSAEAMEPAECCRFPRARFEAFVERHGEVERELYAIAAHELRAAQEQMVLLGRKTAAERLATFLLALFERARRHNVDREVARLPMTRADIADHLGLTKETVSRTFTVFRRRRLIRLLPGDRAVLLDRASLESLASGCSG